MSRPWTDRIQCRLGPLKTRGRPDLCNTASHKALILFSCLTVGRVIKQQKDRGLQHDSTTASVLLHPLLISTCRLCQEAGLHHSLCCSTWKPSNLRKDLYFFAEILLCRIYVPCMRSLLCTRMYTCAQTNKCCAGEGAELGNKGNGDMQGETQNSIKV